MVTVEYLQNDSKKIFLAKKDGNNIIYSYDNWKTSVKAERQEVNSIIMELRKSHNVTAIIGTF